jgi:two-component sensor histidine kinase
MGYRNKMSALGSQRAARRMEDGLDEGRRARENRLTAIFLLGFLAFCAVVAALRFNFYIWIIELSCGVVYVAVFLFAFSIRDYSQDSSSLYSASCFLFTLGFEAAYCYLTLKSSSRDFRLRPEGFFLWISTQWFQAFAFLIVINRNRPRMALLPVLATCSIIAAGLLSFHFLLPGTELLLVTRYRAVYMGTNGVALGAFYCYLTWKLRRGWAEQPEYFAMRTLVSLVASGIACVGLILTVDSSPILVFAFSYCRFVGLALCFNANVTFVLLSPFRALYNQLSSRAEQLSQANERLNAALAEKEILLGEIHHRVKNNLQVVSSLLSLQAYEHGDDGFRESLEESQNRIRAMALVHEMLYQNNDFTAIDYAEYIERIVAELFSSSGRPGIRSVVDCEHVRIPIDSAITCSLIVNELITNCLKHAFPDGRSGTVQVRLRASPSTVSLTVEDDGVGLPEGFQVRDQRSLGFSLLSTLSDQLRGGFEIGEAQGTRITVAFPND